MSRTVRADVVNAVLDSTCRLLHEALGLRPRLESLKAVTELPMPPWAVVTVDVRGALSGSVVWAFDQEAAQLLSERFFGFAGIPLDAADELDALKEVANTAMGNATFAVNEAGFKVKLAPPRADMIRTLPRLGLGQRILNARVSVESGWINLYISLEETEPDVSVVRDGLGDAVLNLVG